MIKKYIIFYKNYMQKFIKSQIIGLFILVTYSLTNIIYPYFLKLIIDDAITNKSLYKLVCYTSIMIGLIILSILLRYIKTIYFFNLGKKISLQIKENIISKIFSYNLNFFRNYKVGEIVSILEQDVLSLQMLFMNIINDIFSNVITFIGLAVILFFLNNKIAIASLLLCCVYIFFQRKFGKSIKKIAYNSSVKRGEFQAFSQELVSNITNIQLHNQKEYFKSKYIYNQKDYYKVQFDGVNERTKSYILDGAFEGINLVLVLWYGGYMVLEGNLTIGSLFTLTLYVQKLFGPIVSLINDYIEIKKAQASIDRIFQILEDNQYKIKSGEVGSYLVNCIRIVDLSFAYKDNYLFTDINLEIKQGEKIALIGDNGSGKSTLMNLVLKLEEYCKGKILWGDWDINDINDSYYEKVLLVKQEPFLFSGSILDNLIMGTKNITNEEIYQALSYVNLNDDIQLMEKGLETIIGEKGVKLSGGQTQKLALARVFILKNRSVIILDEPTSALDLESEDIILRNLFHYKKDCTMIVITHRREVLKYCDKIIEIKNKNILIKNSIG